MKIAIVVDSSSGLNKKQAEANGLFFLPLYLTIDGIEYFDGVNIDTQMLWKILKNDSKVSTSATPIGQAMELMEKLSLEYDKIVVYPISEGLSSQYTNFKTALSEFEKVHVVKSNKVTILTIMDILKFQQDIANGLDYEVALNKLEKDYDGDFLLIPKFNDALVRGGRLTPAAASVAKLLKIVPVIRLKEGKLQKEGIGRIFRKTVIKYFKQSFQNYPNQEITFIHSNNSDIEEIKRECEEISGKKISIITIPNIIAIHTGIEAIAFGVNLDKELFKKALNMLEI